MHVTLTNTAQTNILIEVFLTMKRQAVDLWSWSCLHYPFFGFSSLDADAHLRGLVTVLSQANAERSKAIP